MKCPLTGLPFDSNLPVTPTEIPPLWRLGFRPFFLGGAMFALLAVGLWIFVYVGGMVAWTPLGGWLGWHRHEMPFGFALAIVAGFLLTAVQNWTGVPGVRGWPLAALVGLWGAARLCWLLGAPWWLAVVPELLWLPLLALFIAPSLKRTRQIHNYPILVMLALLALADALAFAGLASGHEDWQHHAAQAAIWLVAALMTMIGGRVIPFFTRNALNRPATSPDVAPARLVALLPDLMLMAATLCIAALAAGGLMATPALPLAVLFGFLALGHALRLWRWHERGIWRIALLWPLHVSYGWMMLACAGLALFHAGLPIFFSLALHALTVGAMGGLVLAMIARVSLAHTGRPLQAPRLMGPAFLLFHLGA
ncbi:MAG: NnrS family protein, partial [Zoogloeaceae bacterium]|nr:NnrS family protein [Zoogloeaceae bacterium]